ncbi:preprotein translocase subunit SecG [Acetitomaculum ruminis DSM 5522]|uniref:Protein-export membrane protein SecG n=1 Tax=Acetitomaculum ruminis DSM 5522 TaxID=1120918 RepID=A0A1I0UXM0_9FIRM|nr:preprotein translocase subunit SecG [Acetitomaculum ruminis]SFA68805.1 preprotein translocase subunit SecG [Acetitomaculum ruminis DSM 5522]
MIRTILSVIFMLICVALTVVILMQEGKTNGLGSLGGGMSNMDTYWSKNKNRSMEGTIVKVTRVLAVLFFALAIVLNLSVIG